MRLPLPPSGPVQSREDKEAKLKAFISEALATDADRAADEAQKFYTLVARSSESPVVKALHDMASEISNARISIRVVLFENEALGEEPVQFALFKDHNIEVRFLNDHRFSSAHEQLTLDDGRVWIGDCMRRDPAKRDAFELYHTGLPAMTSHAKSSFAKLWNKATATNRILAPSVAADLLFADKPGSTKPAGMPDRH